ncbi:hypothetical protein [Pontixanthobacter luteolus]|uniref:hypothetical protein n=1 Tax=Pontixanthobacter luteolus TaxID=295089 RepID=UPI002302BC0A|nr:hypothetical protein [Pontixanthobacter luteolus]
MFSVKSRTISAALLASAAFMGLSGTANAGVVIKSSGPSASAYPVGKKLPDSSTVTLREGDTITIMADGGTRVIRGPGTHRVAARGSSKRSTFAALTRQRSKARVRTGATRAPSMSRPNIWMVDVSRSGTMCVPDFGSVQIWRPGFDQGATYVLANSSSAAHVHVSFEPKQMVADWDNARMPLADGASYQITGPGGGDPATVTFAEMGEMPQSPEALAELLLEKGCSGQLDLLADTMM